MVDQDIDRITGDIINGVTYDDGDQEDYTYAELQLRRVPKLPDVDSPEEHVTDCAPCFIAGAAQATRDLASAHRTPKHFGEVLKSPDKRHWLEAMNVELAALRDMGCYTLVLAKDLPAGCRLIG